MMYDGYVGCATGFGWFGMVLFWIFIILLLIFLLRFYSGHQNDSKKDEKALEVLKKRYAKGEIGKKEFESKKKDLE